jgi:hypothetical protein
MPESFVPPSWWLPGFCATTSREISPGACNEAFAGQLPLTPDDFGVSAWGEVSELAFGEMCVQRCANCSRCHYVSFSHPRKREWRECSWYSACDADNLQHRRGAAKARRNVTDVYTVVMPAASGCARSRALPDAYTQVLDAPSRADAGVETSSPRSEGYKWHFNRLQKVNQKVYLKWFNTSSPNSANGEEGNPYTGRSGAEAYHAETASLCRIAVRRGQPSLPARALAAGRLPGARVPQRLPAGSRHRHT